MAGLALFLPRRGVRWPVVLMAGALALALLFGPAPISRAHTCTPDAQLGVSGHLLLPRASGLVAVSLPDRDTRPVPVLPAQGVATGVVASPDGATLAMTRFWRPPDHRVGGQDILLLDAAGGAPVASIERAQPGEALGSPSWLPDGSLVFERRTLSGVNEAVRVERGRPGAPADVLVADAAWPAASPDGALLALVPTGPAPRLVVRPVAGGDERVVVDDPRLLALAFPRFSPDGAWIAFTAASDPATALAPAPDVGLAARSALRTAPLSWASGSFGTVSARAHGLPWDVRPVGTMSARAHGLPWDVWLVRPDGTGLHRLTQFFDDDSAVAWSPDGRWLATFSAEALHVVSADGTADYCVTAEGGYGLFEWLR